jgi:PPOX class probable FMN-dependent enzyme
LNCLDIHCRHFISLSPFLVLGTQANDGMGDVTPRGDALGSVEVPDGRMLLIPDRPGKNRLDDYSNILGNPEVSLMFLIPGVNKTLRINGIAEIRNDADLFGMFTVAHKAPLTVLKVTVRETYLHCAKALMRSKLWSPYAIIARTTLPSMGQMIKDQINSKGPVESQSDMEARYEKRLY